jgi:hypothetical protein
LFDLAKQFGRLLGMREADDDCVLAAGQYRGVIKGGNKRATLLLSPNSFISMYDILTEPVAMFQRREL